MITSTTPDDWRGLQSEVGRILAESGFTVEIEKKIRTVRGEVELDVYAEEEIKGRKYSIVCECKHWRSRVPQNVVHGFRTVVGDMGANAGYIVSVAGFQEGAFKAIEHTNVELVTWAQFQSKFEESWYEAYLSPQIAKRLDGLLSYTEPLLPAWFGRLTEDTQQRYIGLKERYDEFGWLIMSFTPYARMLRRSSIPTLPVLERLPPESELKNKVPMGILQEAAYRQFFEAAVDFGEDAIEEFRALRDGVA